MATFAQIVNGQAINVVIGPTLQDALSCFVPGYDGGHPGVQWQSVPDGTKSGSKDNGDGTYTSPSAPPVPPKVLQWGELASYLIGLLGGGATGRAALGGIIASCQAGTNADKFFAVYFQGQTVFTKAEFVGVLADVATGIVSNAQKTAVANNWPTA